MDQHETRSHPETHLEHSGAGRILRFPALNNIDMAWLAAAGTFIVVLALETISLSRTVFWWDSGELAANVCVLGIPHRPGFPLYVLLTRVLSAPTFGASFYRINFVSALCASAAIAILVFVQVRLAGKIWAKSNRPWAVFSVFLATLAVIGTYTFWIQAVRAEVYALNLLGIALITLCLFHLEPFFGGASENTGRSRWWFAACFLGGLFIGAHHATFIPIIPPAIILALSFTGKTILKPRALLLSVLLFVLGLSVYLYLPIRAIQNPVLNWGWTSQSGSLGWSAVAATDAYADIAQNTFHGVLNKMGQSFILLASQWGWALFAVTLVGFLIWAHRAPRWALYFALAILGNVAMTAILASEFIAENADLHGYLAPSMLLFGICGATGLAWLFERVASMVQRIFKVRVVTLTIATTLSFAVLLACFTPLALNAPRCVLAHNRLAHNLGIESLIGLKNRSVVFIDDTNWDFVLRGIQYVDQYRQDVTIINRALLPSSWYRASLAQKHPELFARFPVTKVVPGQYSAFACTLAASGFPVYWQYMDNDTLLVNNLTPAGHFYRLSDTTVLQIPPAEILRQQEFESASLFYASVDQIMYDYDAFKVYLVNLYRAGQYYEHRGLYDRARELYRRALSLKPDEELIRARLEGLPEGRRNMHLGSND